MTNLIRYTPARNLRRLHRELDRTVNQIFPSFGIFNANSWNDPGREFSPELNVIETEGAFQIELDLPGVEKEDIEINLQEGILTIRGERKSRKMEGTESEIRSERFFGSFSRALRLPSEIKEKKIAARLEKGVLFVELPKVDEIKPQMIEIS